MVHPPRTFLSPPILSLVVILTTAILNPNTRHVEGWIPRGGGQMANINGQPNRVPSSSSLYMKKRDKKQRKKRGAVFESHYKDINNDVDGIGQISSDTNYFTVDIADGVVARLEAIYGMDSDQSSILDSPKRTKIVAEDWSELAQGPCLGDCCGEDCDEQCDIPEDYKKYADQKAKVDVMAFLGIKRAEPLRVQRDWD